MPVGCVWARRDQRDAHARQRAHAEAAQHRNVRVPAAHEHHVLVAPPQQILGSSKADAKDAVCFDVQ